MPFSSRMPTSPQLGSACPQPRPVRIFSCRHVRRELKILTGRGRGHAELTGGDIGILLLNGVDNILRNEAALVQLIWV